MQRFEVGDWVKIVKNEGTPDPEQPGEFTPGYSVEMTIPYDWIGFPPMLERDQKYRFDAFVTLADPEGLRAETRLTWKSRDPSDRATDDVFTEAVLRPHNWAEARVK